MITRGESSVLTVLLFLVGVCRGSSPVTCSSNNTACEAHVDNILGTYGGVPSLEECRLLCQNNYQCKFLTYYYEEGAAKHVCFLFSSCEAAGDCENCVSETVDCGLRCEAPYTGVLEENIIEDRPDVDSVSDCREFCRSRHSCRFYTYYESPGSIFSRMCFALSHLIEPYEHSEGILTGPVHCEESFSSLCTMRIDGEPQQSFMFTNASSLTNLQLMGDDNCQMRILAVGGGGKGYYGGAFYGYYGGGSGYIQILHQDIPLGVSDIAVSVGSPGDSSYVSVNGEVIVEAPGGDPGSDGGDGSDGEATESYDGYAGAGTGEDVRQYTFENFVLTPGAGGYRETAGGGGGVLVNGGGPPRDHEGQGEGYGGGGEHYSDTSSTTNGLPGIVLIELGPK